MTATDAPPLQGSKDLPDDIEALKGYVQHLHAFIQLLSLGYGALHYKYRDLLRRVHGNKSEKLKTVLKNLDRRAARAGEDDAVEETEETREDPAATPPKKARKHGGGGRRPPPTDLPIVRQVIDLPEEQKAGLRWIRDEITTQTEYRPSQFYQLQIVRPVYASARRECPPKVMPLPPQVIPQASVGVGFIVHVILSKYRWAIPYYRQAMIDAEAGVEISRHARYRYARDAGELLWHVREGLKQKLLAEGYLLIDETFVPMIDPDRGGRTHTAYLWGFLSPKSNTCVLEFSVSRSGQILDEFFCPEDAPLMKNLDMHTDGARMYTRFVKDHPNVQHHLCWQHLRRKLIDALKANEALALPLLEQIGILYGLESRAEALGLTDKQRGYWRHGLAKPILKRLQQRFLELKASPLLFGNLRKAVLYAVKRWRQLASYAKVGRGHVLMDTNVLESKFRPIKIGFKNFLFIGHPNAGWLPAVMYSIMASCRMVEVNVRDYLLWVLPQLAAQDPDTRSAQGLLPHDYAELVKTGRLERPADGRSRFVSRSRPGRCTVARRLTPRECRTREPPAEALAA